MSFSLRIILGILIILLLEVYFYKKLKKSVIGVFPGVQLKTFRRVVLAVLIFANIYPLVLLGGWIYSIINDVGRWRLPESIFIDIFLLFPFWIVALTILQSVIYFLIIDIIRLFILPLYKKHKEKIRYYEARILFALIGFFILYVPIRIWFDYTSVIVRPVEYIKKDLPASLNNFKLVFISDIQADRYTNRDRLQNYINKVNELNPDLILIAGDLITGTPDYINLAAEYVGKLKAKYGVYTCVGDHDNWAYREDTPRSIREITAAMGKYDVGMIDNGKKVIKVGDATINVTFATNTYVETINPAVLHNLVNGNAKNDLKIFLTHQPRPYLIEAANNNDYDLFLAGHTHGGQITFLFPFIYLSPTLVETKYVRGTFHIGDMLMIVTRGLGMSLVPMRYNSTPEITFISIHK